MISHSLILPIVAL